MSIKTISALNRAWHVGSQLTLGLDNCNFPRGHQRAVLPRGAHRHQCPHHLSLLKEALLVSLPLLAIILWMASCLPWAPAVIPMLCLSWITVVFNVPSSLKAGLNNPHAAILSTNFMPGPMLRASNTVAHLIATAVLGDR